MYTPVRGLRHTAVGLWLAYAELVQEMLIVWPLLPRRSVFPTPTVPGIIRDTWYLAPNLQHVYVPHNRNNAMRLQQKNDILRYRLQNRQTNLRRKKRCASFAARCRQHQQQQQPWPTSAGVTPARWGGPRPASSTPRAGRGHPRLSGSC